VIVEMLQFPDFFEQLVVPVLLSADHPLQPRVLLFVLLATELNGMLLLLRMGELLFESLDLLT